MTERVSKPHGATLVELIVTIVIMSIALVSLAMTVSYSASHSADSMIQVKVVELGQAYIEEILTKRFDENSPVGGIPACSPLTTSCGSLGADGEARVDFDDVDDYHGLSDSPPQDSLGVDRASYVGFRVDVQVTYMTPAQILALNLDGTTDAKLIMVTVSPPVGTAIDFTVYKGNF